LTAALDQPTTTRLATKGFDTDGDVALTCLLVKRSAAVWAFHLGRIRPSRVELLLNLFGHHLRLLITTLRLGSKDGRSKLK